MLYIIIFADSFMYFLILINKCFVKYGELLIFSELNTYNKGVHRVSQKYPFLGIFNTINSDNYSRTFINCLCFLFVSNLYQSDDTS